MVKNNKNYNVVRNARTVFSINNLMTFLNESIYLPATNKYTHTSHYMGVSIE